MAKVVETVDVAGLNLTSRGRRSELMEALRELPVGKAHIVEPETDAEKADYDRFVKSISTRVRQGGLDFPVSVRRLEDRDAVAIFRREGEGDGRSNNGGNRGNSGRNAQGGSNTGSQSGNRGSRSRSGSGGNR